MFVHPSHFSAERKEAESACLSANKECVGRLKVGDRREGGRAAVDTSDNPHPTHFQPSPLLPPSSPSFQCKMPETESEQEPLAAPPSDPSMELEHLGFLFDASCLNFFYYSVKTGGRKKNKKSFIHKKYVL